MEWMKISTLYYEDEKLAGASASTEVAFFRFLALAWRLDLGGKFSESASKMCAIPRPKCKLNELISRAILTQSCDQNGTIWYQFVGWDNWGKSAVELEEQRKKWRKKKQGQRKCPPWTGVDILGDKKGNVLTRAAEDTDKEKDPWVGLRNSRERPVDNFFPHPQKISSEPPPRFCTDHPAGTDRPCIACRDARLAAEAFDEQQAKLREQQRQAAETALKHACPTCGAPPWNPCETKTGNTTRTHQTRINHSKINTETRKL